MSKQFKILAVCTGNVCRSPLAQLLLQAGLENVSPEHFVVNSAGSHALVGEPIDARAAEEARRLGVDPQRFRARQLSYETVAGHDLVLGMSRSHRGDVLELAPELLRKTLSLRELARLLPSIEPTGATPAERWRAAIRSAIRSRKANPEGPERDDIIDPYRQSDDVYRQMARELVPAVDSLVDWEREAASRTARAQ